MNRFKGTPAPWVVVDNGSYFHFESINDGNRIGDTCSSTNFYDESIHNTKGVAYANACLIASAPELLEALIEIRKLVAFHDKADVAIAKALGEVK